MKKPVSHSSQMIKKTNDSYFLCNSATHSIHSYVIDYFQKETWLLRDNHLIWQYLSGLLIGSAWKIQFWVR